MTVDDDLLALAKLGLDIEAELNTPLFKFVLGRMVERVDDLKDKLVDLDPEQETAKIRRIQAEIQRFSCMQEDIEQIVNDGRQAHREMLDKEQITDL